MILDDAVFQRVEGDHCASSTGPESCDGLRKRFLHCRQFIVDGDPQGLKRLRGRVDAVPSSGRCLFDDSDQFPGGMKRSAVDDGTCDLASVAVFAVAEDDVCQFPFFKGVDDLIRAHNGVDSETHIQRTILQKGESAFGVIELHGRRAEVEDDAVHCIPLQ